MAIIGIDLGTTNTVASVVEGKTTTVLVQPNGEKILPSMVAFNKNTNEILVGKPAENAFINDEWTIVKSVKSSIGKKVIKNKFTGESIKIKKKDGTFLRPEDISAIILKTIKENAETTLGENVDGAIITVPAYFNDAERKATKVAAKISGLEVKGIINEPTAALMEYGFKNNNKKVGNILVYDFGGGTIDITLISNKKKNDVYKVLATGGSKNLGGDDIDKLLFDYFKKRFYDEYLDVVEVFEFNDRLIEAVKNAKKDLSFQEEVLINLPMIAMGTKGPINARMKFNVSEFEDLISPLVDQTIDILLSTINEAKISIDEIDDVLLVGGSTRIPLVREKVSKALKKQVSLTIDPDESVSKGASIYAASISGELEDIMLLDVISHDIGIELEDGTFDPLINKNSTIPMSIKRKYKNNGTTPLIEIPIIQGNSLYLANENQQIGNILLEVNDYSNDIIDVEVNFLINIDGVLMVEAKDLNTNNKKTITINSNVAMNKEEIETSKESLESTFVKRY